MTEPIVRAALPFDAGGMAALLNAIIERGGTTAIAGPVDGDMLRDWMTDPNTIWHVADMDGDVVGFQWIGRKESLPPEACDIATFVDQRRHGLGIGSRLFAATRAAAKAAGYSWINATIRTVNTGGLAYYQSRGFETYARDVEKERKRYNL